MKSDGRPLLNVLKKSRHRSHLITNGFTIVELLVVIVIIGILAAITIVSYTGIQQKAVDSSLQSDLANASQQIKMFQVTNGYFPSGVTDCPTPATGNLCLKTSSGNIYGAYQVSNIANAQSFRLTANNKLTSYHITSSSAPVAVDYTNVPTNGLIGHYSFDGNAKDHSSNGKDGTTYGATIVDGIVSQAYLFNGTSDYVEVPQGHNLLTPDSTISMWIYSTSWTNQAFESLIGSRQVGNDGVMFFTSTNGAFSCDWGSNRWSTGYIIPLNQWIHLAVTRDSLGRKLYVNGTLFNSTTAAGGPITADTVLQIGNVPGSSYYFQGKMDDVRIYNRALSSGEINTLYNL